MADKIPVKANYTASDVTSLGEFVSGDTVPVANGGTGATTASGARTSLGLGTAATLSTGTSANSIVQLDGSARLPAVDASQLTNLPSSGMPAIVAVMLFGG
jgi:hypothetical protein